MIGGIKNMWSRKIMRAAAVGILAAALMAFPSFAHGHGHHRQAASNTDTSCPVCTVEGCTETGRHIHDDHYYCGYEHSGGYCDYSCETQSGSYCGRGHGCHR